MRSARAYGHGTVESLARNFTAHAKSFHHISYDIVNRPTDAYDTVSFRAHPDISVASALAKKCIASSEPCGSDGALLLAGTDHPAVLFECDHKRF